MADSNTLTHPDGRVFQKVSTKTTTHTSENSPKLVFVDQSYYEVEVIISDPIPTQPASWFGHSAIVLDGETVFSRAHDEYVIVSKQTYMNGGIVSKMVSTVSNPPTRGNQNVRNNMGYYLWVTKSELNMMRNDLEKRVAISRANALDNKRFGLHNEDYAFWDNNCATNVAEVLFNAGVIDYNNVLSPPDLRNNVISSKRYLRYTVYRKR